MRVALASAVWLVVATSCGGVGGPPRGPDYTPEGTPEAASECPVEWKEAKAAREAQLGDDSMAARQKTAQAVLKQADCERVIIAGGRFAPGTHEQLLAQVQELTQEQRDTQNLYNEVGNYGIPLLRLAATAGRGQLNREFATRLKAVPIPTDMTEIGEQSAFKTEVGSLVSHFETEAERELRDVVATSESVAGGDTYKGRACELLTSLERPLPPGCGSVAAP